MKMNLHCFANLIPIMILALFSNSGLINATEVGKRTDALEASAWNDSQWISAVNAPVVKDITTVAQPMARVGSCPP